MSFNIQEIDHLQNQVDYHDLDSGGGLGIRSYDCVFCQRGFTTAQALGGHMNIHRKDRAPAIMVNKPTNNNTTANETRSNKEMPLEEDDNDQVNTTTRLFFSSKSYFSSQHHNNGGTSSFEGRFNRFLGPNNKLGGNSSSLVGSYVHEKRIQDHDHSQDGEEVDLELRLGHYPW